ncbi:hypothetical protein MMC16_000042 [Acarospora aff. strigata]|nr:hypothetical protein [Acarospora aff. strigata]
MIDSQFSFLENIRPKFLPEDAAAEDDLINLLEKLSKGDFSAVLAHSTALVLLGHENDQSTEGILYRGDEEDYCRHVSRRLSALLLSSTESRYESAGCAKRIEFLVIGLAALHAFLQSNVTGPPLPVDVKKLIFPSPLLERPGQVDALQHQMLQSLSVDGEAIYALTPHVELFWLSKLILSEPSVVEGRDEARWARMRVNFWHQRMLGENAANLQERIMQDMDAVARIVLKDHGRYRNDVRVQFLLERAAVNIHHGLDTKARDDLERAGRETGFEFALTGRLGKRTKFQAKETSQLVVLAKSAARDSNNASSSNNNAHTVSTNGNGTAVDEVDIHSTKPQNLNLNDDTLLDSISFSNDTLSTATTVLNEKSLPPGLASLDPSNQPFLNPLDSIILLSIASSITNTSPQHGLTREETLPYATRVLEGGSTNWQIYTQALLVRSRIECYRSRTVERGVLQLQALVDQVIAETTSTTHSAENSTTSPNDATSSTTFLPRPKPSESAPVSERLQYIHQLSSPTRWELEAELAARWVSLGGLKTALEIYERLQMWAEAALCWAAIEREDKARKIVRRQLYCSANSAQTDAQGDADDEEEWQGPERTSLPADAPRLFCILGDIDKDASMYERAWEVSKHRYARAQRSLGRYYYSRKDFRKADEAYAKSLTVNRLDHPTWFALGCVRLELEDWQGAVDAFSRTVQLDDQDAEAWSNLAAALLRLPPNTSSTTHPASPDTNNDEHDSNGEAPPTTVNPQRHRLDALAALKRASTLSHTSYRIWSNLLTVASSLRPPPYTDIIIAQKRLIELSGSTEGEACIDADILDLLVRHVIALEPTSTATNNDATATTEPAAQPRGLPKMLASLLDHDVRPLITSSRRLWRIVSTWEIYRRRPGRALEACEKAWRVVLARPGWDVSNEDGKGWEEVVDATVELVDAYESLGPRRRVDGLVDGGEGGDMDEEGGVLVCKEWRFKARSAVRAVMGRAREVWEGGEGWEVLRGRGEVLKVR